MKKKLFKFRWTYYGAIFIFIITLIANLVTLVNINSYNPWYIAALNISLFLLNLGIVICLFEKEKITFKLINIYLSILIVLSILSIVYSYLHFEIFQKNSLVRVVFLLIIIFFINFYKENSEELESIESIGQ